MCRIYTNLNSSIESGGLTDGSAVRLEVEPQPYQITTYGHQAKINQNKNKISVNNPFQNIVDDFCKFQSKFSLQGRISEVEQIIRECEWTDLLMKIVEYGNKHILLSHKYQLEMENYQIDSLTEY